MMYLLSFLFVMSVDDWFLVWVFLEINMMMFIMLVYSKWSMLSIESCLKYFFVQSLGSALFVMGLFLWKEWVNCFIYLVMSYKIGAGPFFFWFPSVAEGMTWWSCYLLFTFQKVIPMMMLMLVVTWMGWFIVVISLIVGLGGSFNQLNIKRLLAYSSVHHIGWMLMFNYVKLKGWVVYMLMYMLILASVIMLLYINEIESLLKVNNMNGKWWFFMGVVNMAGMPPFLGFFLKWFVLYNVMLYDYSLLMVMILISVVMFYIYLRMLYSMYMGMKSSLSLEGFFQFKNLYYNMDLYNIIGLMLGGVLSFMIMY